MRFLASLIIIITFNVSFSQNPIEDIFKDKIIISDSAPLYDESEIGKIKDLKSALKSYYEEIEINTLIKDVDTLVYTDFENIKFNNDTTSWKQSEFSFHYIVSKKIKKLRLNKVLKEIQFKTDINKLTNEIDRFNNYENKWTLVPLYISRPIISKSGNYMIVRVVFGNDGGNLSLCKKINNSWYPLYFLRRWNY